MPSSVAESVGRSQVRGRTSSTAADCGGNHTLGGGSPFKRQKIAHAQGPPQTPPRKTSAAGMYTFSSGKKGAFVDLTVESPASSAASTPVKSNGIVRPASSHVQPGGGPKKFVVKNLRAPTKADPQDYFNKVWKQLDDTIELIFTRNERPQLLEELYKSVENVCRQGQAKLLFEKLHYRCREHIKGPRVVGGLVDLAEQSEPVEVLREVLSAWKLWKKQMDTTKLVFLYLNQSYLVSSKADPTIDELRTSLFRNHVFSNPTLKEMVLNGACEMVRLDRMGNKAAFDQELFKASIEMFLELKVYTSSFEPKLLSQSQAYFSEWSNERVSTLDLTSFIEAAQATFAREKERCEEFELEATTGRDIRKQLDSFLVDMRVEFLTRPADVGFLLDKNETENLKSLFALLERKDHGSKLRTAFEQYVANTGEAIVLDESKEQEMIPRLLAFKKKLDSIWIECFQKETDLGVGMREAFRKFMNTTKKTKMTHGKENEKTGEMIAKHVDALLRGGLKAVADDADDDVEDNDEEKMNQQLDQVLELFRFLNGKAVFEAFYKKDLARRLLHKTSASGWAEKAMLQRLKAECGAGFTSNLESMFKDVDTSRDENAGFKARRKDQEKGGPELEVNVLESSAWPAYQGGPIEIPQNVQSVVTAFTDYYKQRFPSRKLEWKHSYAHCQLNARFDKNYVVVVSAMQASVLLYFNEKADDAPVGFDELLSATKLEEKDLVRTMQSLACARYRVLKKSTKGPDIHKTDTFTVNTAFSTQKVRFKINQIQLKETKEENKETHERVAADREFETQAAIVRIMKAKQKITHTALIQQVIEALAKRGKVQPEDIKKQIDKLIDKDYMERNDNNTYAYLA